MATAGTVTIRLDGDAATLIRELNKANKSTQSFGKKSAQAMKQAGAAFVTLGAAAGVALAAITAQSIQTNQQLSDTARKLGLTTNALAEMRFAAEQTGVASNQLDLGVQRMTRRIAEAAKGTGEAQGALRELGLDAVRLAQIPIDQQFREISDAMGSVTSQSDKIRLGFKLFDSEGVALISTLAAGREGLDAFAQEARDLGIALSNFDAARLEQAGKAIDKAKQAAAGLGNKISVALAPVITVVAEEFSNMVKGFNTGSNSAIDSIGSIAKAFGFLVEVSTLVKLAFQSVAIVISGVLGAVAVIVLGVINGITQAIGSVLEGIQTGLSKLSGIPGLENFAQDGVAALGRMRASVEGVTVSTEGMIDSINNAGSDAADSWLETAREIGTAGAKVDEFIAKVKLANEQSNVTAATDIGNAGGEDAGGGGIDLEAAKEAQGALRDFLVQEEADRIANTKLLEEDLLFAQFAGAEALALRKQELALELAEFEAEQEIAKQEIIRAARGDEGGLTDQEKLNIRVSSEISAMQQISKANTNAAKTIAKQWGVSLDYVSKLQQTTWGTAFNAVAGFFTKSKAIQGAMFKANKAYGIANAVVSTFRGVAKALELPFPANIAAAATTLAQGLSAVGSIKGAQPGGGATGGGISASISAAQGGASIPSSAFIPSSSAEAEAVKEKSTLQIIIQGDVNGFDEFAQSKIIPAIQRAVQDQDVILIRPESRNAAEIADLVEGI